MDNLVKALMLCRNTDDAFRPELANPHYFKMPNGQLVLFASDGHILLVWKNTAGLLDTLAFEPALVPNIAAVIPTANCDRSMEVARLDKALHKAARANWLYDETAIDIEGVMFMGSQCYRLQTLFDYLGVKDTAPMALSDAVPSTLKIETDDFIIVQAGIINEPRFYKHLIKY